MVRPRDFATDVVTANALDVFQRKGYSDTSVQDLVDSTGLSRSSIYNAFHSKRALYEMALRRYDDAHTTQFLATLDGPGTAQERIRRLLTFVVDGELQDSEGRGCMIAKASLEFAGRDAAVSDVTNRNLRRIEAALLVVLQAALASGEIARSADLPALAHFLVGVVQGLRVLGKGVDPAVRSTWLCDALEVAMSTLEAPPRRDA